VQVDLSLLSTLATGAIGLYAGLLRYSLATKEREIERRIGELEGASKTVHGRLADEEKATVRVESVREALAEIKRDMVKRETFEAQIEDMRSTQRQILSMLRSSGTMGSYSSMAAVRLPPRPTDPPKR
jgi:hypothetical protein